MKNLLVYTLLLAGDKEKDFFFFSCLFSNFQLADEIHKCSRTYKTAYRLLKPIYIASTTLTVHPLTG